MLTADFLRFAWQSLTAHRLRTFLSALGIAIGITAVILLTSIGRGLHSFVIDEFTQFGTNIIGITPGHTDTRGGPIGAINTVRPLSIDDALALRRAPHVLATDPTVQGNGDVEFEGKSRRVMIYGVSHAMEQVMRMQVSSGEFLPDDDPRSARAMVVLGAKVARELYGENNPLGTRLRVGGERYRVVGVMEAKGQVLGLDLDDTVYIPVGRALEMFNRESLMEIHLTYEPTAPLAEVEAGIRAVLSARHGREDYTVTPQQKMLETFGTILDAITFAVAAIGGISLLVGGIGILTILTIAVSERTAEIGLLRAIGATRQRILLIFLGEAAVLAGLGGAVGLGLGWALALVLKLALPALPLETPWSYALAAELMAVSVGLAAGVLPARRAALLDPLEALRSE
ncbi:ABC transporter permease [Denitratisoma oestradiolicum]|uniref:Peptide ABC transporter permease n=1 Tax=Denitratisoma oestradiolicum TaxID=311182 RepID=A0A6S6Y6R0_9PROT|nr:ABC transporter permease [Denitratisoma oestradiolicum]TWO78967.1 peptide ABC transporter permease [Denitratisoma oestradiolicum]CAB1368208.1 Peptide ABC transporter permease [Denitratisoma oestradiolicum]